MTPTFLLAAGLLCAQVGANPAPPPPEDVPAPRPAPSKIVAATVYRGQALVTREVAVPEAEGSIELVVTPLPPTTVDGSLYAEGAEGIRILSTRFRSRVVREDSRRVVREVEESIRKLGAEVKGLVDELEIRGLDLRYLQKLESFTGTTLNGLTEKARLDSEAVVDLSKFIMETRSEKSKAETDLRLRIAANAEATAFAKRRLGEIAGGSNRIERDAVVVVRKSRPGPGTIRLGHLVGGADWTPQYRLRGAADDAPVRLEYLGAVTQQTGEAWPDVRVTLSTARPTLDSAPPDLLPLKMDIPGARDSGPIEARDDRSQRIVAELNKVIEMSFQVETPLSDFVAYVRKATSGPSFPDGIPIYVDPQGLQDADKTLASTLAIDLHGLPLRTTLRLALRQLSLAFRVRDGLLTITSNSADDLAEFDNPGGDRDPATGQPRDAAVASINRRAAGDQEDEMRVGDDAAGAPPEAEREIPGVSFAIAGTLGLPSRPDPQILEVGRVELPAEYYAKAVPVLTQRVYRLAKLSNPSELVFLPGEATVYVGSDFVGRMRMPLVAAGEPFIAGFGVDPQLQVARRMMKKARTVQGGNQVFAYEFRIGLRNFRPGPVKVQLWDRLPTPEGEAVVVNLVRTSTDLSTDPLYLRTARADNLLRWDLDIPGRTFGEKTHYLTYEFRLEYAKDLARPRFLSGGLNEDPIGGGAMGGMGGGMGGMGGFRTLDPAPR